jgi:hypothetical protein
MASSKALGQFVTFWWQWQQKDIEALLGYEKKAMV